MTKPKPHLDPTPTQAAPERRPRSAVPAALSIFDDNKVSYELMPVEPRYLVADAYEFIPSTNFWRALDGSGTGYGASTLVARIKGPPKAGPPALTVRERRAAAETAGTIGQAAVTAALAQELEAGEKKTGEDNG